MDVGGPADSARRVHAGFAGRPRPTHLRGPGGDESQPRAPDGAACRPSGGDGGCDVAFPTAAGEDVFELKSRTGRATEPRRSQLKEGLARARGRRPVVAWRAVVPVNLTPKEQESLDHRAARVRSRAPGVGGRGSTEGSGTTRSSSAYFSGSGSDEVVEAFRDFTVEQEVLTGGLQDGVNRVCVLAWRIDDLNPIHRVRVTIDGATSPSGAAVKRCRGNAEA